MKRKKIQKDFSSATSRVFLLREYCSYSTFLCNVYITYNTSKKYFYIFILFQVNLIFCINKFHKNIFCCFRCRKSTYLIIVDLFYMQKFFLLGRICCYETFNFIYKFYIKWTLFAINLLYANKSLMKSKQFFMIIEMNEKGAPTSVEYLLIV